MNAHHIICVNGELFIDDQEVPFPDGMTYDRDTHETILRYHGLPAWMGLGSSR